VLNFYSNQVLHLYVSKIYFDIELRIFIIELPLALLYIACIFIFTLTLVNDDSFFLFREKNFKLHLLLFDEKLLDKHTPYVQLLHIASNYDKQTDLRNSEIFWPFPRSWLLKFYAIIFGIVRLRFNHNVCSTWNLQIWAD